MTKLLRPGLRSGDTPKHVYLKKTLSEEQEKLIQSQIV